MGSWDEVQFPAEDLLLLVGLRSMFCVGEEWFCCSRKLCRSCAARRSERCPLHVQCLCQRQACCQLLIFKSLQRHLILLRAPVALCYRPYAEVCHLVLLYVQTVDKESDRF